MSSATINAFHISFQLVLFTLGSLVPLWLLFFFTRKTEARTRLVISQLGSRKPCGHTCGLEVSQSRDLLALTA